jgi:GH15 family glucan-1,4-alpha-glucosidase
VNSANSASPVPTNCVNRNLLEVLAGHRRRIWNDFCHAIPCVLTSLQFGISTMSAPIEDYALIGDCHSGALVSRDGSIDWLCLPRFDSGACFAGLLGTCDHGRWQIRPVGEYQVMRRYRVDTLILETEFTTADGMVTVIDFMPPRATHPHVARIVVGKSGRVPMNFEFVIRPDYGSLIPWVQRWWNPRNRGAGWLSPDERCRIAR